MAIDALAFESQFLDHLAPVWETLPASARGRLLVDTSLVERARSKSIEAEPVDAGRIRTSSPPPLAQPGDGPTAFVVSIGDIKIGRRLGYRRFVFMEHGAGQAYLGGRGTVPHPSYPGGMDREDVGLFLVPNEYSAALWREAYPGAAVEIVGSPRLDGLPSRIWESEPAHGTRDPAEPHVFSTYGRDPRPAHVAHGPTSDLPARGQSNPTVAISFHWPAQVAPEADTALGHYFTSLRSLAERLHVIGHAHPKGDWPRRMDRVYRRAGIEFVPDFDDVLRRADVYVCDNSTTLFEFAATGRPVVVLNQPAYRRSVHHGLRFWDAATVGVQVDEPRDLIRGIELALADPPELREARERALDVVYAYRSGGALRAAGAIETWLAARVEVAA